MANEFKSLLNNQWVVAGAIGLIGAYIFKDQICPVVDIPGLCDSGLQSRSTANCDAESKMCVCPHGEPFQMGASRTCKDCARVCKAGHG